MRTLTLDAQAAVSATVTKPGHLIQIEFAPPIRYSTLGDVTIFGQQWAGNRSVSVRSISDSGGSIQIGNIDDAFAAIVLSEGVADRRVRIWAYDGEAVDDDDAVLVFDGVGDSADVDIEKVVIRLESQRASTLNSPRRFIGPSAGFNHLIAAGTTFTAGNQKVTLERW